MSTKGNKDEPSGSVWTETRTQIGTDMSTPACDKDGKIPIPGRTIFFFFSFLDSTWSLHLSSYSVVFEEFFEAF